MPYRFPDASVLVVCLLLITSCASTPPLTRSDEEAAAKAFVADPQRAIVYVFADFAPIHTHNIPVVIGTRIVAQMGGGTFMVAHLPPGESTFTSVGGADNPPLTLDVRAGQIYFLRMHQLVGYGYLGGAEYIRVDQDRGTEEVKKRRQVAVTLK